MPLVASGAPNVRPERRRPCLDSRCVAGVLGRLLQGRRLLLTERPPPGLDRQTRRVPAKVQGCTLDQMARPVTLVELRPEHWSEVADIYEHGIATGDATFETTVPSWEEWDATHL